MLYANKCISIYSIVLLQLATSTIGTKLKGEWLNSTDQRVVKVNDLLETQYSQILHEILETLELVTGPAVAASMIYLEVEKKGKADRTAVIVIEGTPKQVETTTKLAEHGASGGDEPAWFSIVLDYLNLDDGVDDSDRLRIAKDIFQNYTPALSLIDAQNAAKARVEAPGVIIEMRILFLRTVQKKIKRVSESLQRASQSLPFMKKPGVSKSGESSSNEVNPDNPPLNSSVDINTIQ